MVDQSYGEVETGCDKLELQVSKFGNPTKGYTHTRWQLAEP